MITKQALLTTLRQFKNELKKSYKLDQMILPKDENGNVIAGEQGQILQSNGDGTYSWTNTVLLGKFYIEEFGLDIKHAFIYEIGMTWEDFINSNCNTEFIDSYGYKCMLTIGEDGICCSDNIYYNSDGEISDVIINGHTYEPVLVEIEEMPLD